MPASHPPPPSPPPRTEEHRPNVLLRAWTALSDRARAEGLERLFRTAGTFPGRFYSIAATGPSFDPPYAYLAVWEHRIFRFRIAAVYHCGWVMVHPDLTGLAGKFDTTWRELA
jgi:hypothetical protein